MTKLEDIRAWLHGKEVKGMPKPYGKEGKKARRAKKTADWDGKTMALDVHGFPFLLVLDEYGWEGNALYVRLKWEGKATEEFLRQLRYWKELVDKKDPDGNKKGFLRTPEWTWKMHRMQLHELQVDSQTKDVLDVSIVFRAGNTKKMPTTK